MSPCFRKWSTNPLTIIIVCLVLASCVPFPLAPQTTVDTPTQELTPVKQITVVPTINPTSTPTIIPLPTLEPIPTQPPDSPAITRSIRLAYTDQNQIWIWENGETRPITLSDKYTDLVMSEDGRKIVFTRAGELRSINTDGSSEKIILNYNQMKEICPSVENDNPQLDVRNLVLLEWIPGTKLVMITTEFIAMEGSRNGDLYILDTETDHLATVFLKGTGGDFHVSPDGKWIAVVMRTEVQLMHSDGTDRVRVMTYTYDQSLRGAMYSPSLTWSKDSQSFLLELVKDNPESVTIWKVPINGNATVLTDLLCDASHRIGCSTLYFSPDLSGLVYHNYIDNHNYELHVADSNGENDQILNSGELGFLNWLPDSSGVIFYMGQDDRIFLANFKDRSFQNIKIGNPQPGYRLRWNWVDESRFLVSMEYDESYNIQSQPYHLWIGEIGGRSAHVIEVTDPGFFQTFDYIPSFPLNTE